MSAEENKAIIRQYTDEVFNRKDLGALERWLAASFVDYGANQPPGIEPVRRDLSAFLTAFPDLEVVIDEQIAQGDKVANRYTIRGTHRGEFFGIPPTNREATWSEIDIVRLADGKLVERWAVEDRLSQQQQLGLIPARGGGRR